MKSSSQDETHQSLSNIDKERKNSIMQKRTLLEHLEPISDGITDQIPKLPKSRSFDEKNDHQKMGDIENSLVHSWSYCLSDSERLNCELEMSTTAEEFFKGGDHAIITELLNEILDNVCGPEETSNKQVSSKLFMLLFDVILGFIYLVICRFNF